MTAAFRRRPMEVVVSPHCVCSANLHRPTHYEFRPRAGWEPEHLGGIASVVGIVRRCPVRWLLGWLLRRMPIHLDRHERHASRPGGPRYQRDTPKALTCTRDTRREQLTSPRQRRASRNWSCRSAARPLTMWARRRDPLDANEARCGWVGSHTRPGVLSDAGGAVRASGLLSFAAGPTKSACLARCEVVKRRQR